MKIPVKVITIFILFTSVVFAQSVINAIPAPRNASGLCWTGGYLWCGAYGTQGDTIYKIDPINGNVLKRLRWRVNADCYGLAFDTMMGGSLWVSDHPSGPDSIWLVDTTTGARITAIKAHKEYMSGLANDGQYLWHTIYYSPDGRVYHINKTTGVPFDSIDTPSIPQPWGATWDGQYLWVCNDGNYGGAHRIYKINVTTKLIIDSVDSPGTRPFGLAWDGQYLWVVANGTSPTGKVAYQIDLQGSGTPDIQVSPTTYNFNNVPIGTSQLFSLLISNVGTDTLTVDTIFSQNTVFHYATTTFPIILVPNGSININVNFSPATFQYYSANLGIVSDDPDEETVYVSLRGQGVYPNPTLSPSATSYNFGDVRVSYVRDWFLRIVNQGYPLLRIDSIRFTNFNFFTPLWQYPISIATLETTIVQVITRPTNIGNYTGTMKVYSNDPTSPTNILLSANGISINPIGGELLWSYDFPDNVVCVAPIYFSFGDTIIREVAAESYGTDTYGKKHLKTFWGVSHSQGVLRWAVGDTGFTGSWGDDCLIQGDDYNNDYFHDILLGTAWGDRSVYAINARNGQILWFYDSHSYDGEGGWVYSVKPMPDITGDGIGEVLAGIGGNSSVAGGPRSICCFNGANGNIIWQFRAQDAIGSVDWIPDVNNDGVPDAICGAWGNSYDRRVYCISGASSGMVTSPLWQYNCGGDVQSVIAIPDINGDNKFDVVAGAWSDSVFCLSGANGARLWATNIGGDVLKVVPIPNLIGQNQPGIAVARIGGIFNVLNCTNGSIYWNYAMGSNIWTVDAIQDLNSDGKDDVITGSQAGMIYCFSGANGSIIWTYNAGRLIYSIRAISDISGDNKHDVLVGTQKSSGIAKLLAICGGYYPGGIEQEKMSEQTNFTLNVFPNPCTKNAIIRYTVQSPSKITIKLYNSTGQLVTTLKDEYASAGAYQLRLNNFVFETNRRKLAKGIYFLRYEDNTNRKEVKLIIE